MSRRGRAGPAVQLRLKPPRLIRPEWLRFTAASIGFARFANLDGGNECGISHVLPQVFQVIHDDDEHARFWMHE